MNVGLNTLYNIGSNYSVKLNEKETLVYENDDTRDPKKSDEKKLQQENEKKQSEKSSKDSSDPTKLNDDEKAVVNKLQARDAEVRTHESAHQAAGAGMTGAASFSYQQGPDGKMYAIGGEVGISFQTGSTPQETIKNAQQVIAAAMAPANPSPQDYSVASSARMMMLKAQQQEAKKMQDEAMGKEVYKNAAQENEQQENKQAVNE